MKAMAGTTSIFGALRMECDSIVSNQPERSATPMPSMMMSTWPSGANAPKVLMASPSTMRIPSAVSRFTAVMTSPVPGCFALQPRPPVSVDSSSVPKQRLAKMTMGSGNLLPVHSMKSRNRSSMPFFGLLAAVDSVLMQLLGLLGTHPRGHLRRTGVHSNHKQARHSFVPLCGGGWRRREVAQLGWSCFVR